jgi:hypothetical protein
MDVKLNPTLSTRPQSEGVTELGVEKDIWALEGRITGGRWRLHNEELHYLNSFTIIR